MPTKQVPIDELRVGMYVAKLDLSWLRSPFLRHSFLVQEAAQIERLVRAGVKTVHIDLERGWDTARDSTAVEPASGTASFFTPAVPLHPSARKSLAQLNEEYTQAKLARAQLEQAVQGLFAAISERGTISRVQTAEAIQEIMIAARTLPNAAIFMALSQHRAEDSNLSEHALGACTLSLMLGQAFQLNPLELHELATAGLLHDMGLLQVPPPIVRRSHVTSSPLSEPEQRRFQAHPRLSILMLERQGGFDTTVLHVIGEHHAYLDGGGYPPETRGEFTSLKTRILMIADKYDELITGFGGASPLAPSQALQRLYQEAQDGVIDPDVLSRLIKTVGIYPVHSHVRLSTGELAVVVSLNPAALHRPVVAITHDSGGAARPVPLIVDLAQRNDDPEERSIEMVLDGIRSFPPQPSHAA
jgi:HD-GYP domain-containing protein (c-di-GMP phosphodiesterase class II)